MATEWVEKEITEREFDGSSSHVGFVVPSGAIKGAWDGDNWTPLHVRFNGARVFRRDRKGLLTPLMATRPQKSRKEIRVQALRPLIELGLRQGLIEVRTNNHELEIRQQPVEQEVTAWLAIAAGDSRSYGGNDGYGDVIESHYFWDNKVHRHDKLQSGHVIVLWDKECLLGMSVIDSIENQPETDKIERSCRKCGSSKINDRARKKPKWRCNICKAEFEAPVSEVVQVTQIWSNHATWWTDLRDVLSGDELRDLVVGERNQPHSIRELVWPSFCEALAAKGVKLDKLGLSPRLEQVSGFRPVTVKSRLGQAAFRSKLLKRFGNTCLFTGIQPEAALDAAHLYSYAQRGIHHDHGGVLMRADLHRLFDRGLIGVNPSTKAAWIGRELKLTDYAALEGKICEVGTNELQWLAHHYDEFHSRKYL